VPLNKRFRIFSKIQANDYFINNINGLKFSPDRRV